MSTSASAHVFVYGTLMSTAGGTLGRAQRARLAREGRVIGAATMSGRLYDLGRYPGLVTSEAPGDVVHGEVVALENAPRTLAWLDAYEQIVPGKHEHNQYARELRPARLTDRSEVAAWVYVYRHALTGKRLIRDGRWIAPAR